MNIRKTVHELFSNLDAVFVINLKNDKLRRKHVIDQFHNVIDKYEFVDAVSYNDPDVKNLYSQSLVMSFPPCFRCFKDSCGHENNFLGPKQVGNFLSFKKVMEIIIKRDLNNILIFEDDCKFTFNSRQSFKNINIFLKRENLFNTEFPLLIKIGSHTRVNKKYYLKFLLTLKNTFIKSNHEDMANPCLLINQEFAKLFLKEFNKISTTSDNFIHRLLSQKKDVITYSIYPFPVTQLSYGRKNNKFKSSITAARNVKDRFTERNRVETSEEYRKLLIDWFDS